jgi:hypothetical protein
MNEAPGMIAVCVDNRGLEASLIVGKVYYVSSRSGAERHGFLRVVDESGEDYLFPQEQFVILDVGADARQRILASIHASAAGR